MTVCVNCERPMLVKEIGVLLVTTVGKAKRPHSIVDADIEWCPPCGAQIIARVADESLEHFQDGFYKAIEEAKEQKRVYYVHEKMGRAIQQVVVPGS